MDVEPLDGDAELAGRGEAGADGARRGLLDVGVLKDQHGVLAAEFQGDADQAGGGSLGDLTAGAGGAGEGDVVGVLDDLGADDRALAEDDLEDLGGQPGLDEQVTAHRAVRQVSVSGFITTALPATKAGSASPTDSSSG